MSWSLFGSAMTPMDPAMKEKNEILRAMDLILKAYKTRVAAEAKLRNLIAQDTVTQLCLACNTVEQGDVTQSTKDEKTSISIGDSKTKPLSGGDTAIASAAGVASGSALTDDSAKVVIATSASPMKSRVFQIKDLVHVYWNDSIHWQEGRLVGMKKQLNGLMEYTVASGDETKFVSEKELRFPESNKDGIRGQVTPKHDFVTNDEIQEAYIDLLVVKRKLLLAHSCTNADVIFRLCLGTFRVASFATDHGAFNFIGRSQIGTKTIFMDSR